MEAEGSNLVSSVVAQRNNLVVDTVKGHHHMVALQHPGNRCHADVVEVERVNGLKFHACHEARVAVAAASRQLVAQWKVATLCHLLLLLLHGVVVVEWCFFCCCCMVL